MSDSQMDFAIYSFCGPERLACLSHSIRKFEGKYHPKIVVVQDFEPSGKYDDAYRRVCKEYDARLVQLKTHSHMSLTQHIAVEECQSKRVAVYSDDVMQPRDLYPMLVKFFEDNESSPFMDRVAGAFLFHWDRADVFDMVRDGRIPELASLDEQTWWSENGSWFWNDLDGRLPDTKWSEPTPADQVGVVTSPHGSGFIVDREKFLSVGGCAGCMTWQNDSLCGARINNFSSYFFIRLPGIPALAHFGGAAAVSPDPTNRWTDSVMNLAREHGAAYCDLPELYCKDGSRVPPLATLEIGWRLRAYAIQRHFETQIKDLDYSYRELAS